MKKLPFLILAAFVFGLSSCATVQPYQRAYLNDNEMKPGNKTIDDFNENVHSYREGASGGGSKAGGGCGCN